MLLTPSPHGACNAPHTEPPRSTGQQCSWHACTHTFTETHAATSEENARRITPVQAGMSRTNRSLASLLHLLRRSRLSLRSLDSK